MATDFPDDLPAALREIRVAPLFVMRLSVLPMQIVGQTPGFYRRVGIVSGGSFSGSRLSGEVLTGGNDWQAVGSDGNTALDVRLVLTTHDGALIGMSYRGMRNGPAEVIEKLESGETVDPAAYYFRMAAGFETASPAYAWLNKITAIATGHRLATGPVYSVFEVL